MMQTAMTTLRLEKSTWSVDYDTLLGEPGEFGSVFAGVGSDGAPVAIKILHSHLGNEGHRELEVARACRSSYEIHRAHSRQWYRF